VGFSAVALHGALSQGLRNRRLMALREGRVQILVATDVAARGIDVPTISHVFNFGLPMKSEDYVHRIGRTGRAGRDGLAVTFAEWRDRRKILDIEAYTKQPLRSEVIPGLEPKNKPEKSKKPFGDSRKRGFGDARGSGRGAPRDHAGFGDARGQGRGAPRDHAGFGGRSDRYGDRNDRGEQRPTNGHHDRRGSGHAHGKPAGRGHAAPAAHGKKSGGKSFERSGPRIIG
jgi:superfamily II DNA/RNA helicase